MYTIVTDYKLISKQKWNNFVFNHPDGNIFHTPEMVELYEATPKFESLVVGCFDEIQQLVGLLIAVIQKEYEGLLGKLTARAIVYGGPLVMGNSPAVASLIIEAFDKLCKKKVVYSQFRNLWDVKKYSEIFSKQGYIFEDHLDILFNLKQGKEVLWKEIHPTRRKQINRGIKREIKTKIVDLLQPKELVLCYTILKSVYKEAKLPFPSIVYFTNAIKILIGLGYFKAVLALYINEIIGFRFFLTYKGLLYDWYAGSRPEHYNKYPNDILPWEIIKWGAENGYDIFDFGGAGKPDKPYGVRDYKMKFGGTLVNYGRFEKSHKPFSMAIARIGFRAWKILNN